MRTDGLPLQWMTCLGNTPWYFR